MNSIRQTLFYTRLGFIRWHKNPKIILIFISISCLLTSYLYPILSAIADTKAGVYPFYLFPFLLSNRYINMTLFFGLLVILWDIPTDCKLYNFSAIRSSSCRAIIGHFVYIILAAVLYFVFILLFSVCFFAGNINLEPNWGKALYTMGFTNMCAIYNISLEIKPAILIGYSSNAATLHAFVISVLSGIILALISFAIRLVGLHKLSFVVFPIVCLNLWFPALPYQAFRLSPTTWVNLNAVNRLNINVPSIGSVYIEALILIIVLALMCCNFKKYGDGCNDYHRD